MKSEKGVTLVSLIIYVIAMLITVTVVTIVTSYFYKNVDIEPEKYTYFSEFTKVESYFADEVNREGNRVLKADNESEQHYVAFSSGNQYTFVEENKALYQNNVKIANDILECNFEESIKNGKDAIKVKIKIQDKEKELEYVLKN